MTGTLRAAAGLLLLGLAIPARADFGPTPGGLRLSGSARELLRAGSGTDADRFESAILESLPSTVCVEAARFASCPAFDAIDERDVWESLTRVRTRLDLAMHRGLSAAITYDHVLELGVLRTLEAGLGSGLAREELLDLEDEIHVLGLRDDSEHARWSHSLYRAHVRWEGRLGEIVVGRQRIPWGVGRLWTPIDRFNAISPLALEADESPGVDAVDLEWRISDFTFLEGVWAPRGRTEEAAAALRLHGSVGNADYSLMAGVFDRAWTAGVDLAANLADAVVRVEAVFANPEREVWPIGASAPRELEPFWQVVVSVDRRFDLGSGLYVLLEHFYDGNALGFGRGGAGPSLAFFEAARQPPPGLETLAAGLPGPFVRPLRREHLGGSQVLSLAEHQTGLQLSYEPLPSLSADFVTLFDWTGGSVVFFPALRYSGFAVADLALGVQIFTGPRRSAFGDRDPLAYVLLDFFY